MAADSSSSRQSSDSKQDGRSAQDSDVIKKEENNKASTHEEGKMFIGGLNWETTDESLKSYFSQYGEVTDCIVMRDPNTGRSRGFGFLTFVDPSVVNTVLVKEHQLDGKIIDPKRAIPREEQEKTEKIFVGGIAPEVSEEEFKEYFIQFGNVIDATLMVDRDTGRPRGFGFITFDSSEPVEKAMSRSDLEIQNKPVEVKRAMPKHKSQRLQTLYSQGNYGSSSPASAAAAMSGLSSSASSASSRYSSPYGISGVGKDGSSGGYSGLGSYNPSSYPGYGGYGQYSNYNYPSSYPSGYAQYNAMNAYYSSSRYGYSNQYGGSSSSYGGSGSRGGSYSQWYGREGGYGSGGPSSGSGSAMGGPSSSSRLSGAYRHSPGRDESYRDHHHHHHPTSPMYGRGGGSSRSGGPARSSYSSSMNNSGSSGALYSSHQVRGQHNYHPYARLVDFEKICPQQNFKLPSEILTPEVLAKKSTKAGVKTKAVRTSSRIPKPKKTEEVNVEENFKKCKKTSKFRKANDEQPKNIDVINKIEGSSTVVQHRSVKRTYTDNADSAATLAWKAPNFPRKKKKTIHLNEQQIRALPEQPNLFANYNGRAFIENPFMRQSTPSVLIQGAYKLNAEQIERSFIQACFRRQTESTM